MSRLFAGLTRSELMSRIRSRGNKKTELALIKIFRAHKITGWRRHQSIFGKPDFIFPKFKLAVFVDGCFWHGCPTHGTSPKSNTVFWLDKIARNQARDKLVNRTLRKTGWRVVRIWEHELSMKHRSMLLAKLRRSSVVSIPN